MRHEQHLQLPFPPNIHHMGVVRPTAAFLGPRIYLSFNPPLSLEWYPETQSAWLVLQPSSPLAYSFCQYFYLRSWSLPPEPQFWPSQIHISKEPELRTAADSEFLWQLLSSPGQLDLWRLLLCVWMWVCCGHRMRDLGWWPLCGEGKSPCPN